MDELDRAQAVSEIYEAAAMRTLFNKRKQMPLPDSNTEVRRCTNCNEIIPRARIEANPNAVRCIGCQTKAEKETE
jgi:DnaK suppressor protein